MPKVRKTFERMAEFNEMELHGFLFNPNQNAPSKAIQDYIFYRLREQGFNLKLPIKREIIYNPTSFSKIIRITQGEEKIVEDFDVIDLNRYENCLEDFIEAFILPHFCNHVWTRQRDGERCVKCNIIINSPI